MLEPKLTYGLDKGNVLRHVDNVKNGLACNCFCPKCNGTLAAINNPKNKKQHHFRHYQCPECVGAQMTVLHKLAQEILREKKNVMLPDYHNDRYNVHHNGNTITFDCVILEQHFEDNSGKVLVPDCVCSNKGKKNTLWVEFLVTHSVDENKATFIKDRNQYCIEINLSDLIDTDFTKDILEKRILSEKDNRHWICCPNYDNEVQMAKKKQRLEEERELERQIQERNNVATRQMMLQDLAKQWFERGDDLTTEQLLKLIPIDPYKQKEKSYNCCLFDYLVENEDWAAFITKAPKNKYGLQVFYALLKFYYRCKKNTNYKLIGKKICEYQCKWKPLTETEQVELEELVCCRLVASLEKERKNYKSPQEWKYTKEFLSNLKVRHAIWILASINYNHIIGIEHCLEEKLVDMIELDYPYMADITLKMVDNNERNRINFLMKDPILLDRLRTIATTSSIVDETINEIANICFKRAINGPISSGEAQESPSKDLWKTQWGSYDDMPSWEDIKQSVRKMNEEYKRCKINY